MRLRFPKLPTELAAQRITRLSLGYLATFAYTEVVILQQAIPLRPLTAILSLFALGLMCAVAATSAWLAQRGRVRDAARLLAGSLALGFPMPVIFFTGVGTGLGLLVATGVALITIVGLPEKQARWWALAGALVGGVTFVADLLWPAARMPVFNSMQLFSGFAAFAVCILVAAARNFGRFGFKPQLMLATVAVAALPVIVLSALAGTLWNRSLLDGVGANLHGLASVEADQLGQSVREHLDVLRGLSVDPELAELAAKGAPHLTGPDATADQPLDWYGLRHAEPALYSVLTNEASQAMDGFIANFPEFTEVFITDRHGALVAANQPTSDFYQADEVWWQQAWNGGLGAPYIGPPAFDASTQVIGLQLALPLADGSGQVVGVLRGTYNLEYAALSIADLTVGRTGGAELWLPNGLQLGPAHRLELDAAAVAHLRQVDGYGQATRNLWPQLVSAAPVRLPHNTHNLQWTSMLPDDLGWTVLVYQQRTEALEPALRVLGWAVAAVAVLIGSASIVSLYWARRIGDAVDQIGSTVAAVRAGDLSARTGLEDTGDDLSRLASAVDHMTESLEQRAAEARQARTEIDRHVARVGALLEATSLFSGQLDEQSLWEVICEGVAAAINVQVVTLLLYAPEDDTLRMVHGRGLPPGFPRQPGRQPAALFFDPKQLRLPPTSVHPAWISGDAPDLDRFAAAGLRPLAKVHLWHNQTLIGVLMVGAKSSRPNLSDDDQLLLLGLGSEAAIALANSQLYEQARRRAANLIALRNIDQAIIAGPNLPHNMEVVLDQILSELHVDAAAVLLFDEERETLSYTATRGLPADALPYHALRLEDGLAGQAAQGDEILEVADLRCLPAPAGPTAGLVSAGLVAYFGAPLLANNRLVGVLELFHGQPLRVDPEWRAMLETLAGQAAITIHSAQLFLALHRSNDELTQAYEATLDGWSHALDLRDRETEGHTRRVTEMSVRLAELLGLREAELTHVRRGALLHDIGKMGVPDAILLKPGPLTPEEFAVMSEHPRHAYNMLRHIAYLEPSLDIPYCHHERWDGTGYPRGLRGEAIPFGARLFALVDVWDALRSDRPYRAAWPVARTAAYIRERAGTHFDPNLVEPFLAEMCRLTGEAGQPCELASTFAESVRQQT